MKEKQASGLGAILRLAGKNRVLLLLSAFFSVVGTLCSFIPFIMVYKVLMFLFEGGGDIDTAIRYGVIAAMAILGKFLFAVVSGAFSHIGAFNTLYNVRAGISRHIANVNLGFFTDNASGEIKKVIIEDVERIEKFLAHQIPDLTAAVCAPVIMFIYLCSLSVPMALCLLAPVVLGAVVQAVAMSKTGSSMPTYHRLLGKLNATIMQFINGMPVMKTYNMTAESYKEYAGTVSEYNSFWKSCTREQGYTYGIFVALVESGILFALPLGGWLFLRGSLPVGTYLFFMVMSMVFLSSLLNLISFAMSFNQITSGVRRIQKITDLPATTEGPVVLKKAKPHSLSFQDVTFSYGAAEVLRDVNLDLPAGSLTAFVGASGAGKTTAAQLIPKFWEVSGGSIAIDGQNINGLQTTNLMDLVSFVFQDTFMLNDSIYQNIAIGGKSATRQQVEDAARAAQIHDFIMGLPNGYDTKLGEDGVKMSGGEKQRICIARAILKDAPIIVFDEATSYTDIENEHKIQLALGSLLKGKTTIMIAHRLHTIVGADQICVFDRGRVVERGTHAALLAQNGLYAHMWKTYTQAEQGVAI